MGRSLSVNTILSKKYPVYELPQEWREAIGEVETNFRMIVWGPSGSGKTTFVMKLCKALAGFGRVYYNSIEQGEGKSIQDVLKQVKMDECKTGTFILGDKDTYEEMVQKLSRNRARFVVVDSVQYANLTTQQYKDLIKRFPKKAFILISWEGAGANPKGEYAKAIRYMVDIKTYVKHGTARTESRFGHTVPYTIFEKKTQAGDQLALKLAV